MLLVGIFNYISSFRSFLRITLPLQACLLAASSFDDLGIFGSAWITDARELCDFWNTASKSDLQKEEGREVFQFHGSSFFDIRYY